MRALVVALFWSLSFLALSPSAFAFPEMIRHGYVNCTSCHVSPTGGGVLNPYGREISSEVLSTWGTEKEARPAYFIDSPQWLNLGGDYRSAYLYENTPDSSNGQYIFMQADAEAAVSIGPHFVLDGTLGYQGGSDANSFQDHLIARRYYLMYKATDQINVRAGKFLPAFGIGSPDHAIVTRDDSVLSINNEAQEQDTYNLEFSYIGDDYNVYVTGILGRPDNHDLEEQKGLSLVASRAIAEHYRVGFSYYYGRNDLLHRNIIGPYAMLGFTPQLFLLSELDFQGLTPSQDGDQSTQWGFAQSQKLGYEIHQGLIAYIRQEFARMNFADPTSIHQRYGAGIQFFPRPHFEFDLEYQRRQEASESTDFTDYAYLFWHFYL